MADENNMQTAGGEAKRIQTVPIKINMLQGEQSGQPIYSNLTHAQASQAAVLVDFGFLDANAMAAINQALRTGDKSINNFNAKMACRMILSTEAANQLSHQLHQLLSQQAEAAAAKKAESATPKPAESVNVSPVENQPADAASPAKVEEPSKGGFRFPWSKK